MSMSMAPNRSDALHAGGICGCTATTRRRFKKNKPLKREGEEECAKIIRHPVPPPVRNLAGRVRIKRACTSRFSRNFPASRRRRRRRCHFSMGAALPLKQNTMCAIIREAEGVSVSVTTVWHDSHSLWWPQKTGRAAAGRKWHFHYESHSRAPVPLGYTRLLVFSQLF